MDRVRQCTAGAAARVGVAVGDLCAASAGLRSHVMCYTPNAAQGHFYDMNMLAYSPDGQFIVTGGDDGKV